MAKEVCEHHNERTREMSQTRSKVDSISGKLTVLIILIAALIGSHGFLYLQFNSFEKVTLQYIAAHMVESDEGFRRIETIEKKVEMIEKRVNNLERN